MGSYYFYCTMHTELLRLHLRYHRQMGSVPILASEISVDAFANPNVQWEQALTEACVLSWFGTSKFD